MRWYWYMDVLYYWSWSSVGRRLEEKIFDGPTALRTSDHNTPIIRSHTPLTQQIAHVGLWYDVWTVRGIGRSYRCG